MRNDLAFRAVDLHVVPSPRILDLDNVMFGCATGFRNHRRWGLVIGFGCLANALFYSISCDTILGSRREKFFIVAISGLQMNIADLSAFKIACFVISVHRNKKHICICIHAITHKLSTGKTPLQVLRDQ